MTDQAFAEQPNTKKPLYESDVICVSLLGDGIAELSFDAKEGVINKFDQHTVASFSAVIEILENSTAIKGLLITSAKTDFIVGADITEFLQLFRGGDEVIANVLAVTNDMFNRFEALPFPTCVAINGVALGGGFEFTLACDFRLASDNARVGLPETKLGIMPGWGGSVRLPRLLGLDEAITWIASGAENRAAAALKAGAVDGVVAPEKLRESALTTLRQAIAGRLDYLTRRQLKQNPMPINRTEGTMAFVTMKAMVAQQAGEHYPAPVACVDVIEKSHKLDAAAALQVEADTFKVLAKSTEATSLVGIFLGDQYLAKKARKLSAGVPPVTTAGVLGAGIMGGGIAYQCATSGIAVKMKDIAQAGLDQGLSEANKLLSKRVAKGRLTPEKMGEALNRIDGMLTFDCFDQAEVVVEAVVENPKIKAAVLGDVEMQVNDNTVITSNTSTISISSLATSLQRPENFCGLHFFNPVHAMPLVEVIRGDKTSDETVAKVISFANALGKKPVVVNDCPGFLVNRVLFPYFDGFAKLLRDGADYRKIDKIMERWGWPMGPAYLLDVVGLDTAVHAAKTMASGFPDRMTLGFTSVTDQLFEQGRLGQKNGKGYYDYRPDKRGKIQKTPSADVAALALSAAESSNEFTVDDVVMRMMLPMITELARCLEENIVASPIEADMALAYGVGFPPFRGGIFRWVDHIGLAALAAASDKYRHLGATYQFTEGMHAKLTANETYY